MFYGWVGGINNIKAHIRKEKKTAPLKLGEGMLLQEKNGKIYKVCDTVEYDETHTDDEVIKIALSAENMIQERNSQDIFNNTFVFVD